MQVAADEKKIWAEELLRQKKEALGRLPCKGDFDEETRCRIKAFLGPWPRALESAGLKAPRIRPKKSRKRKKPSHNQKNENTKRNLEESCGE